MQKESVSKQGRKSTKAKISVHKDPAFNELDDDVIDYMETKDAQDVGRARYVMHKEKESAEKEVSTEDALSTDKQKVSTNKEEVGTNKPDEGTDKQKVSTDKEEVSTDRPDEGTVDQTEGRSATPTTPTPTPTIFEEMKPIAPSSSQHELTKSNKGKKKIKEDESDTESEDINESEKKFKMLAHDEEIARKMQEDWEAEEERKRLAEEEATNAALIQDFDDIKARIEANRLLALRLQEEEREQFTMEERAKFLHDTIAAQRRFLAEQRAAAIRNRPPTRTQLRNERKIKEMNEGASDPGKKKSFVKEDVLTKVPAKLDVAEQGTNKRKGGHMKMLARKRKRPQPDVDNDNEHKKCLKIVTFEGTIDSEIMERRKFPLSLLVEQGIITRWRLSCYLQSQWEL
ncbi:hypothetical protein Tco_1111086 [Tanacetum coccineum]|uniref:Uncharacterized protein n=1 Tax=Tanacetum coccineum TaxID=301880 RepID=A0ABQ5IN30_9ASTR